MFTELSAYTRRLPSLVTRSAPTYWYDAKSSMRTGRFSHEAALGGASLFWTCAHHPFS